MGSIEMTDYERRLLAAQSLESNVQDENFCELFPDLTMVIICILYSVIIRKYVLKEQTPRNLKNFKMRDSKVAHIKLVEASSIC